MWEREGWAARGGNRCERAVFVAQVCSQARTKFVKAKANPNVLAIWPFRLEDNERVCVCVSVGVRVVCASRLVDVVVVIVVDGDD